MIMLTMLKLMPDIPIMPSIQIQLINMGINETRVNSIRPYDSHSTVNTSIEDISAILPKSELMMSTNFPVRYCLSMAVVAALFSNALYNAARLLLVTLTSVITV